MTLEKKHATRRGTVAWSLVIIPGVAVLGAALYLASGAARTPREVPDHGDVRIPDVAAPIVPAASAPPRVDVAPVRIVAPPPPDPADTAATEAEADTEHRTYVTQQVAALEQAMADRSRDPSWSLDAERSIQGAFQKMVIAGARLEAATCTSSLCRIDVRFDSDAARDDGTDGVTKLARWRTSGFVRQDPDDPLRLVVYASRTPEQYPRVN